MCFTDVDVLQPLYKPTDDTHVDLVGLDTNEYISVLSFVEASSKRKSVTFCAVPSSREAQTLLDPRSPRDKRQPKSSRLWREKLTVPRRRSVLQAGLKVPRQACTGDLAQSAPSCNSSNIARAEAVQLHSKTAVARPPASALMGTIRSVVKLST